MVRTSEYLDYLFEKTASQTNNYDVLNEKGVEKHKNRTSILKDRVIPVVKNQAGGLAAGTLGGILGAGAGYGSYTATRAVTKQLLKPENAQKLKKLVGPAGVSLGQQMQRTMKGQKKIGKLKKPMKVLFSDEYKRLRRLGATAGGAGMVAPKFYEAGKVVDRAQDYQKKHLKAFGTEPTEAEYLKASGVNTNNPRHSLALALFNTPDAMIKSKKRSTSLNDKIEIERMKHAEYVIEQMEKRAKFSPKTIYSNGVNKARELGRRFKDSSIPQKTLGSLGGAIGGATSTYTSDKLTDEDAKYRKLKLLAGTGVGAIAGAGIGNLIGKDVSKLTKGISKKMENPDIVVSHATKFAKSIANDAKRDYGPQAKKAYDAVKKKVKDLNDKSNNLPKDVVSNG